MTDETRPQASAGDGVPASGDARRDWVKWPPSVADEVIRRAAAGETLRMIGGDPQMPSFRTINSWIHKRPAFRAAMQEARAEAARAFGGGPPSYCRESAGIIFQRLCEGEGLVKICREDPTLPSPSTIYRWMAQIEEFREAVALAREIAGEGFFEKGWELAEGATPETAYVTDVRLKHLRWHAGKLNPRKYGSLKPADPPPPHDEDDRNNLTVVIKRYFDTGEFAPGEDEKVLYRMKQLPPTPAERRAAARERAEEARDAVGRERGAGAETAGRREGAEPAPGGPEKPWDPDGWT